MDDIVRVEYSSVTDILVKSDGPRHVGPAPVDYVVVITFGTASSFGQEIEDAYILWRFQPDSEAVFGGWWDWDGTVFYPDVAYAAAKGSIKHHANGGGCLIDATRDVPTIEKFSPSS